MPAKRPRVRAGRHRVVWGALGLVTVLSASAVGQPDRTELLRALDLAGYSQGERPPEFNGRTADGQGLSLAGLRGKVVVLAFWATWCLPCREELSLLEHLHRGLAPEGLAVVGVNVREDESGVREYAEGLGLTFPLIVDRRGDIQVAYGVIGLPTTFLIARDGRAVARAIGPRDWGGSRSRALIRVLLGEPAGGR